MNKKINIWGVEVQAAHENYFKLSTEKSDFVIIFHEVGKIANVRKRDICPSHIPITIKISDKMSGKDIVDLIDSEIKKEQNK